MALRSVLLGIACVFSVATTTLAADNITYNSVCPFNYPPFLNYTLNGNGLITTLALSIDASISNKALQLISAKTNDSIIQYAGLKDGPAPVLLSNLKNGGWYSQSRNSDNQLYDRGPTGYLAAHDEKNGTARYAVAFANATSNQPIDKSWLFEAPNFSGTYGLYHQEDVEVSNGFMICKNSEVSGIKFTQLFYYTYKDKPYNFDDCQYIGVRATVGPHIFNGQCNIGGYVASQK